MNTGVPATEEPTFPNVAFVENKIGAGANDDKSEHVLTSTYSKSDKTLVKQLPQPSQPQNKRKPSPSSIVQEPVVKKKISSEENDERDCGLQQDEGQSLVYACIKRILPTEEEKAQLKTNDWVETQETIEHVMHCSKKDGHQCNIKNCKNMKIAIESSCQVISSSEVVDYGPSLDNKELMVKYGRGGFADVYVGLTMIGENLTAYKLIRNKVTKSGINNQDIVATSYERTAIKRDKLFLRKKHYACPVKLSKECYTMPFVEATFFDLLKQQPGHRLCTQDSVIYLGSLVSLLRYLHIDCTLAHLDLKAENIGLNGNKTVLLDLDSLQSIGDRFWPCGTPGYAAQEVVKAAHDHSIAQKTLVHSSMDMFSFGMLFLFLVTGIQPSLIKCTNHGNTPDSDPTLCDCQVCHETKCNLLKRAMMHDLHPNGNDEIVNYLMEMFQQCTMHEPGKRWGIGKVQRFLNVLLVKMKIYF
ncbi:uncharacterized protein [Clytia hemisphaerica]|uniref:uncharacterized protein isoform X1 n=1 Tax=Clytia hemisphaerica TaxID=252671 RepID=UPI0034D7363E